MDVRLSEVQLEKVEKQHKMPDAIGQEMCPSKQSERLRGEARQAVYLFCLICCGTWRIVKTPGCAADGVCVCVRKRERNV